jgi:hypothetical protein
VISDLPALWELQVLQVQPDRPDPSVLKARKERPDTMALPDLRALQVTQVTMVRWAPPARPARKELPDRKARQVLKDPQARRAQGAADRSARSMGSCLPSCYRPMEWNIR